MKPTAPRFLTLRRLIRHPRLLLAELFDSWQTRQLSSISAGSENSKVRDRWVKSILREIPGDSRLLDAGSGEQQYRPLCSHLRYVSQDHLAYDGVGDGIGGHVPAWTYPPTEIVCDITEIPEPDEAFDAVLCTEVIEHVSDPKRVLEELARVIRPGGQIILTAPFYSFTHFAPFHFCTGFSKYWYEEHLARLGFTNILCEPNGNFFEVLAQEIRRLPQMANQYHVRPLCFSGKLASIVLLRFLSAVSTEGSTSSDYACMGWHVTAIKGSKRTSQRQPPQE